MEGTEGNDTLIGTEGDDNLKGLGGDDIIDGKGGADRMDGGPGDDIFYVDNPGDTVIEAVDEGTDEVRSAISYALPPNVENLHLLGNAAIDGTGNGLPNLIVGNAAANVLDGGGGADTLVGGQGDDVYYLDSLLDVVVESAGEGTDTIVSSLSRTLGNHVENLVLTGTAVRGVGNALDNRIIGNAEGNLLEGLDGDDYIDGGAGGDHMTGGNGNDTYVVDSPLDRIHESPGGGDSDHVLSYINYNLDFAIEHLTLLGNASINGTGNHWNNRIIGNAAANVLDGGGGDDSLYGEAGDDELYGSFGNDLLDGGAGADAMFGGQGSDTFIVDHVGDRVVEAVGGGANDRVFTRLSYALAAGQEIETLSAFTWESTTAVNLTGNEFANYIIGNDGNNVIDGGAGADVMVGRGGNDRYIVDHVGDRVVEAVGGGANDAVYTKVSYALAAGQEIETLSAFSWESTAAIGLTGNEFANYIIGNDGNNVIDGKGGNDILIGRGGADTFAFTTALGPNNVDRIVDFAAGVDKIALDDAVFTALSPGALGANAFVVGSAATSADHRIIYDSTTGALYYDSDGNGAGAAVLFATLDAGLGLTASDFTVI